MEVELSKILPNNSIITPIFIDPPKNHNPRNYKGFNPHMGYSSLCYKIGKEKVDNMESAVFVRNPYYQVLSHFFMMLKIENLEYSKKYLDLYFENKMSDFWLGSTKNIYTIGGKIAVKNILYYENGIEKEINKILSKIGISNIKIETWEKKFNKNNLSPFDVFDKKHIDIISQECSWEFENLGYKKHIV